VNSFAQFIEALAAGLPQPAGSLAAGVRVFVQDVSLVLPIESRIEPGGVLHASLPRGQMATGFVAPLGRLALRFESETCTLAEEVA
jgi:hypothetical protein